MDLGVLPGPYGFKAAIHHTGEATDPDNVDRKLRQSDKEYFLPTFEKYLPKAKGPIVASRICTYENSEDGHFRLGIHPKHKNVIVAAGFSGHGFKFQPVMGEILTDLALNG